VHYIDEGVDTGRIVSRKVIGLEGNDTIEILLEKGWNLAAELMTEAVLRLVNGEKIETASRRRVPGGSSTECRESSSGRRRSA